MTINDSTLRSNVFETIYDILNTDKSLYGASLSPSWIPTLYGGMPDLETIDFPSIIVMPITANESEFTIGTRTFSTKDIAVNVMLFTKKNKDLDYLSDGVVNSIRTSTSDLMLNEVNESFNAIYPNEQKIKSKTISFIFKRR